MPGSKYRKIPVVIEAMKWDGQSLGDASVFLGSYPQTVGSFKDHPLGMPLFISTLEGEMRADPGDWIIKGVKGEFYPCKPDIFWASYEPAVLLDD
jgi:hypothetical protein